LIIGTEVARLSRNCADWHRLLELCALFDTLIADADGVYNPRDFNDRLLLGLKGTLFGSGASQSPPAAGRRPALEGRAGRTGATPPHRPCP
ncbi:MAG TPA: hypothetical protein VKP69_19780, partial [Isosphaeraceae bacterium]|nr:hypothetical protein [Isosphaeraceae bacterium]